MTTLHVREIRVTDFGVYGSVAVCCSCGWATPSITADGSGLLIVAILAAAQLADQHLQDPWTAPTGSAPTFSQVRFRG